LFEQFVFEAEFHIKVKLSEECAEQKKNEAIISGHQFCILRVQINKVR